MGCHLINPNAYVLGNTSVRRPPIQTTSIGRPRLPRKGSSRGERKRGPTKGSEAKICYYHGRQRMLKKKKTEPDILPILAISTIMPHISSCAGGRSEEEEVLVRWQRLHYSRKNDCVGGTLFSITLFFFFVLFCLSGSWKPRRLIGIGLNGSGYGLVLVSFGDDRTGGFSSRSIPVGSCGFQKPYYHPLWVFKKRENINTKKTRSILLPSFHHGRKPGLVR